MSEQSPIGTAIDVVFRPARFLDSRPEIHGVGVRARFGILIRSLVFLVVNLALYAVPVTVTLAGFSVVDPLGAVVFIAYPFLLLTGVTVWALYAVTIVTGTSRGFVGSVQTAATTTGVYLALALGFAFPLLVSDTALGEFIRGVTLYLFVFGGDTVTASTPGRLSVVAAAVAACYYIYSLYLAARLRHGASRFSASIIALVTAGAPVAVYPWLAGDEVVPAVLSATPVIVVGGVAGLLSLFSVAIDFVRTSHK